VLPDPDSPVWFHATIFNGVWTVIFTATLALVSALAPGNTLLLVENAVLFIVFGCLEVVSTAFYGKEWFFPSLPAESRVRRQLRTEAV
jgi:hypothetical protein